MRASGGLGEGSWGLSDMDFEGFLGIPAKHSVGAIGQTSTRLHARTVDGGNLAPTTVDHCNFLDPAESI